jgi:hypothetical protein
MPIKIKVTQERFEEVVSIDDEMHFGELSKKEIYDYMLQFCVNGDDTYLPVEDARKLFKKIPAKELSEYVTKFFKSVSDAFVNPTNGATSDEQSSQE